MSALGSTPTSTSAATLTREEDDLLAGLPTAIWTKIFAHFYSYEQDPSNRTLAPLLLSRPLSALAHPELYRHPSVSFDSLAALDAALKLPRLEADVAASLEAARLPRGGDGGRRWEEDKKCGTRASYVRSLTVRGRRERVKQGVKRAWDHEAAQDGVNDVVHTQNEGTGKAEEGEREEGEVLEPPEGTVSHPSLRIMARDMRTGSTRSLRATVVPPRPQRPPTPPASTVHPLLPSLLSQVTLDTLVLKDTYVPDAASARVFLSALESTVPRRAEIELRLWPADMVDPVRDRLLAHTPDLASRDAALARYAQARLLTPALIPGTLELHTAWLGAVMSGSRLDTSVLDAATDAAERIHAMLLEWIRGLYATRAGLVDYSGRPRVVEKVALDRAELDAHLARLAEVGVNLSPWESPHSHLSEPTLHNPSYSFRHFLPATVPTKDQAEARAAYDTFVDDMNRATWRACIEPLRALARLATGHPLRISAHLSQVGQEEHVDGAEIPPSVPVADLEALLATVSAKPPRTPQAALLVLAGTFMRSTVSNAETECSGMHSLPTALDSGQCPDDFDDADLPGGYLGWQFRADDLIFDAESSEPAEPNATVNYVPNPGVAVRADLELSSPLPFQTEGTSAPDWSDMYNLAAATNVDDPPSTSGAVRPLAWLANQVPILPASEHSTPLLLDDDPGLAYVLRERLAAVWAAWGRGELLNNDPKQVPKSNKPCISLSLSAVDPLAAQTITARNRSLYPRIGIQAISVTLPHALAPLSALGEADVERHPGGLGLLHPSTTSFQVRIHDEADWADEMWYAGYLPPEVVRSFVQVGSGETRTGRGGVRTGVKWMDDGEGKEAEEGGGGMEIEIDSDDYASPDFESDSSYVDVDESEMEPEFDGAEGETFDRAAAEEQARRIAARRAAKVQ